MTPPSLASDARVLVSLLRGHPRGDDHAANLEAFYGGQAEQYDAFRERLLPGRQELYAGLAVAPGSRLVELGAGTGRNLAWLGHRVADLAQADLVDLCEPLLAVARRRWQAHANVACHRADACTWQPEAPADIVVMAYALTMIPDWQAALANALAMLRPGGQLAVVDFTLTPEQRSVTRSFWKAWFGHDGVHPDLAHLPALRTLLPDHEAVVAATHLPYLPGLAMPYYRFLGRKAGSATLSRI